MDLHRISAALFVASALATGCYTPNITGGAFSCGDGGACPSGFRCAANGRCYSSGVDAQFEHSVTCDSGTSTTSVCSGIPISGECNPGCQSGCACGWCAVVDGASQCLEGAGGTKDVGVICDPSRPSDCKAGLYCQPECGTGRCYKLCDPSNDTCGGQSACDQKARKVTDGGTAATPFGLCRLVASCDPTATNSATCPAPFGCYPTGVGAQTECDCAGNIQPGQSCLFLSDCQAGYSCNGPAGGTTCLQTCTTTGQCAAGSTCTNHTTGPFGYCM
ncbi:MAG TPA: hypothetical protein VKZ18_26955 [Polyangia bacterium]|nr:hypothetical protein [Polyangia bacterium]